MVTFDLWLRGGGGGGQNRLNACPPLRQTCLSHVMRRLAILDDDTSIMPPVAMHTIP